MTLCIKACLSTDCTSRACLDTYLDIRLLLRNQAQYRANLYAVAGQSCRRLQQMCVKSQLLFDTEAYVMSCCEALQQVMNSLRWPGVYTVAFSCGSRAA